MSEADHNPLRRLARRALADPGLRDRPDRELLRRFLGGDEAAFGALLARHGPVVLDVCRSMLGGGADADDAFQATFLVLARRAGSIRRTDSLAGWLHGVAHRTALKARASAARRRRHEARAPRPEAVAPEDPSWSEVRRVLHEELARLSASHRDPLVVCYLHGKTQDQAAALLGLPRGTLKRRLERGRALLRARLVRRGLGPAATLLASAWPAAGSVAVPPGLAAAAAEGALLVAAGRAAGVVPPGVVGLADEVTRAMTLGKWAGAAGLLAVAVGLGGAVLVAAGRATVPDPLAAGVPPVAATRAARPDDVSAVVGRFVVQLRRQQAPQPLRDGDLGLFLLDVDAGDATLIASAVDRGRTYCGSPSWSADGRRIYFDASPGFDQWADTRMQVFELTDAGVRLSSLGPGNCPTASPDGGRIAYRLNSGAVAGARPGLHVAAAGGGEPWWLGEGGLPRWSPDGRHLLTATFSSPTDLAVVDPATGEAQPVRLPGHQVYSVPSWAGDGAVAAVVRSGRGFAVALVDVSDPSAARVAESLWRRGDGTGVEPMYPVYSPALRRGVFVGREPGGQALYAFAPGEVPRRLEPGRRLDPKIASLALSPDGRYVLFCGDRPGPIRP